MFSRPQRELSALMLMDTDVQQTPTRVKCAHVDGYVQHQQTPTRVKRAHVDGYYTCSADPNAS